MESLNSQQGTTPSSSYPTLAGGVEPAQNVNRLVPGFDNLTGFSCFFTRPPAPGTPRRRQARHRAAGSKRWGGSTTALLSPDYLCCYPSPTRSVERRQDVKRPVPGFDNWTRISRCRESNPLYSCLSSLNHAGEPHSAPVTNRRRSHLSGRGQTAWMWFAPPAEHILVRSGGGT